MTIVYKKNVYFVNQIGLLKTENRQINKGINV